MKFSLRRVTGSGRFIPEIDGLRFIAISSVLAYHINGEYLKECGHAFPGARVGGLQHFVHTLHFGVQFFFAISGFVLGLPFVRQHCDGGRPVSLRHYYLRRLTRIEPPYMINLVIVLGLLLFYKRHDWEVLQPHFWASLGYLHNALYQQVSEINFVTWSLEIEVQFYLLAPLLALFFAIPRPIARWTALTAAMLLAGAVAPVLVRHVPALHLTLIPQLPYFLAGFLVAGCYADSVRRNLPTLLRWDALALAASFLIVFLLMHRGPAADVLLPASIVGAYVGMLRGPISRRILSLPLLTIIGGMCYTIYLYHPFLKSALKRWTFSWRISDDYWVNAGFQILLLSALIVAACSILFFLFERPFMFPQWPQTVARHFRQFLRRDRLHSATPVAR